MVANSSSYGHAGIFFGHVKLSWSFVTFQRARCHEYQVKLLPRFSSAPGYVQVLRVRMRVHFCNSQGKNLEEFAATDPIEISWHPTRQLYPLRASSLPSIDNNGKVGNLYLAHRLIHQSDLQSPNDHNVVLGTLEMPGGRQGGDSDFA